jgi:protease I
MNLVMHDFEPGWDTYVERMGYIVESDISFDEVDPDEYAAVLMPEAGRQNTCATMKE